MKIAVLGNTLYAGVMSGLLAESGYDVFWCQGCGQHESDQLELKDESVIQLLDKQLGAGFLHYCDLADLTLDLDVYIFSFTPAQEDCVTGILQSLSTRTIIHPKLMINASTLGLNGTEKLQQYLPQDNWIYLPDIIQEGHALNSINNSQKIMIGCDDATTETKVRELLRPLFSRSQQYLFMPILDAEFAKLSISGMLATRISYINDLAVVAEKLGIDIANVREGMASDSRIGSAYLYPGAGFGGENFSHDILTLSNTVANTGVKSQLLAQVWDINEQQKELMFRKLWNYYHGELSEKTIAIWGASFKANTSSVKQSPIHPMLAALWAQGVTVRLHDPQALGEIRSIYGEREDLIYCQHQYEAVEGAHALCILTAWKQYSALNYALLKQKMAHPLILDGRNLYDPSYVRAQGFAYMGVGR